MQLQFGDHVLEADIEPIDLQDLATGETGKIAKLILEAVREQTINLIRDSVRAGKVNEANNLDGYLLALEDLSQFFNEVIPDTLKETNI
jgi:hypothetical protein